jgi:hypothetical protein
MKLPDFKVFASFNALKDKMGIPRDVYGNLHVEFAPGRLTLSELKTLGRPAGLDVSLDDIVVLPDGTLGLKGQRVVLYIRDKATYGTNYSDPKYHLANCITLVQMKENNVFGKYVANNNTSGRFEMNIIKNGTAIPTIRNLAVCQNCLEFLRFRAFAKSQPAAERGRVVSSFSMTEFFEEYPKSFHAQFPQYDSRSAPLNNYTSDWTSVSRAVRERADWRCQEISCQVNLSAVDNRRYLQVHHRNGQKNDNSHGNLVALCIYCHAKEAMHHQLKYGSDYKQFLGIRPTLLRERRVA